MAKKTKILSRGEMVARAERGIPSPAAQRHRKRKRRERKSEETLLHFFYCSGVVQLAALQTLDLAILVRVQAPEPFVMFLRTRS